jgi:hypothetical protein
MMKYYVFPHLAGWLAGWLKERLLVPASTAYMWWCAGEHDPIWRRRRVIWRRTSSSKRTMSRID